MRRADTASRKLACRKLACRVVNFAFFCGLWLLAGPATAAPAKYLRFLGVLRGGQAQLELELAVRQRASSLGFIIQAQPAPLGCQQAGCLEPLASLSDERWALFGEVRAGEAACLVHVWLARPGRPVADKNSPCGSASDSVAIGLVLADIAGALLESPDGEPAPADLPEPAPAGAEQAEPARRLPAAPPLAPARSWVVTPLLSAPPRATDRPQPKPNRPWPLWRRLTVAALALSAIGLTAGAVATGVLDGRPACGSTKACDPEVTALSILGNQMPERYLGALHLEVAFRTLTGLAVAANTGMIVAFAL